MTLVYVIFSAILSAIAVVQYSRKFGVFFKIIDELPVFEGEKIIGFRKELSIVAPLAWILLVIFWPIGLLLLPAVAKKYPEHERMKTFLSTEQTIR